LIAAGLLEDSRAMMPRIQQLLDFVLEAAIANPAPAQEAAPAAPAAPAPTPAPETKAAETPK